MTNFGGGNTSAKLDARDPVTGAPIGVLWVKGSGGDLGSIGADGFAAAAARDAATRWRRASAAPRDEDVMAGLYRLRRVRARRTRAPSIDTPLHALLPYRPHRPRPSGRGDRPGRRGGRRGGGARRSSATTVGWTALAAAGLRAGAAAAGAGRGQAGPARRDHGRPRPDRLGRDRRGLLRQHARPDRPRRGLPERPAGRGARRSAARR